MTLWSPRPIERTRVDVLALGSAGWPRGRALRGRQRDPLKVVT